METSPGCNPVSDVSTDVLKERLAFEEQITGEVSLSEEKSKKKRTPRRVIHFVDGSTLDEYSTDEEDEEPLPPPVDPRTLTWLPWFWFWLVFMSSKALAGADFCGEKLAWFFGITTPKYQYIIDEYHRIKEEEEEEKKREEAEQASELSTITTNEELSTTADYTAQTSDLSTNEVLSTPADYTTQTSDLSITTNEELSTPANSIAETLE